MGKQKHYYDVQNHVGDKVGKRYFSKAEVKACCGSNSHKYDVQNNVGKYVGKRYSGVKTKDKM